jgi:hypothetical protein
MNAHRPSCLLLIALWAWPGAGAAREPSSTIVGFSRDSKRLLLRTAEGPRLLDRQGKPVEGAALPADKRYRHGTALEQRGDGLAGKGIKLTLDGRGRVLLVRGKARIPLHAGKQAGCKVTALEQGWRSPNRQVLALLLRRSCPDHEPVTEPVVIVPRRVGRRLLGQSAALAGKGRLKAAGATLARAALLLPGDPRVVYRRACLAALGGEENGALAALRRLKGMSSATARRLFVKARFDRDFRLIKDSAGFKALFSY